MQPVPHRLLRLLSVALLTTTPCVATHGVVVSLPPTTDEPVPPGYSVGAPGTPFALANPGTTTIVITEGTDFPVPRPVSDTANYVITNVAIGDVIFLLDPARGQARSNWSAVLRFLDPDDPTGAEDIQATEDQAFLARDMGPDGFANFTLFPNVLYAQNTSSSDPANYYATNTEYGTAGGIRAGQTAIFLYHASDSAIPEPGATAILVLSGVGLAAGTYLRRRKLPIL